MRLDKNEIQKTPSFRFFRRGGGGAKRKKLKFCEAMEWNRADFKTVASRREAAAWTTAPWNLFFGHMKHEMAIDPDAADKEIERAVDKYIEAYRYHRYQEGLNEMTAYEYGCSLPAA